MTNGTDSTPTARFTAALDAIQQSVRPRRAHFMHATLCVDDSDPSVCAAVTPTDGDRQPFIFIALTSTFELFAHDPASLRRLAERLQFAADCLEDALAARTGGAQ